MGNDILWTGALVGALMATWNYVKQLCWRLAGLMLYRATLQGRAAQVFYEWLVANTRVISGAGRYFTDQVLYVKPIESYAHDILETSPPGAAAVHWWRGRPLIVKYGHSFDGLEFICLRGTFPFRAVLRGLLEERRHANGVTRNGLTDLTLGGELAYTRYEVRRFCGSGSAWNRQRVESRSQAGERHVQDSGVIATASGQSSPSSGYAATVSWPISKADLISIARPLIWQRDDLQSHRQPRDPWHGLYYPEEVHKALQEVRHWIDSREWYHRHALPWRLSWLLCGSPGTGKSSMVRAIAQQFDMPVMLFDLAGMDNRDFMAAWREAIAYDPCIVLLEDFDAIFNGRTNTLGQNGGGLTYDCVLNALSGIEEADGVFSIITTNHPETFDPAMYDHTTGMARPGRVDRVITLRELTPACKEAIVQFMLGDIAPELISTLLGDESLRTAVQVRGRCQTLALERYRETTPAASNVTTTDSSRS